MAVRIQFRRGTAAEWAAANPVLASGELGYETDTSKLKIGSGSTAWNSLAYASISQAYVDNAIANVIALAPETLDTLNELAAAINDDPNFANTINNSINSAISTHDLDTTNVHGITNTMALETTSGAQSKADAAQSNAQSYATNAIANLVDSAPGTLDTLNELAAALGDDPNFATSIANTIATKLSFLVNTGSNFRAGNVVSTANTVYIDTTAPGFVRIGDGVNIYDSLPDIGSGYAIGILETHNLDTTNVHGIANTANLLYQSDLTTHAGVTTNIHGISNAANLVYQTELSSLQTQVNAKLDSATASSTYAPLTNPTFIDSVTLPANTAIGGVSSTEIGYLNNVSSSIQTQMDGKQATITGAATTIVSSDLTTSRALASGSSGKVEVSSVTSTELGYVSGVTSAIQTQIDSKAPTANAIFSGTVSLPNTTSIGDVSATEIGYLDGVTSLIQTQVNGKLSLSGGTMTGKITLDADPTQALHAVTKQYVDNISAGLHIHEAAHAATNNTLANLVSSTVTYDNGTDGVGATLTLGASLETLDGHSLTNGDRILVKNEANAAHNGIYVRTSATVLTRADDFNSAAEIAGGDFTFVENGTLYNSTGWVVENEVTTVGTDDILWAQFMGAGTVTGGNNITVSGTQVSVVDSPSFTGTVVLPSTTSIGDVSATEIGYLNNVSSSIQTQLDAKSPTADPTFTGTVTVGASGIAFTDGAQTKQGVPSITTITPRTASYTLADLTERDTIIEISNASATTLTVPLNSSVAYPVGTTIDVIQTGVGQVTIAATGGVTVNATPGLKLRAQWSSATLLKRATDTWLVYGDLTA